MDDSEKRFHPSHFAKRSVVLSNEEIIERHLNFVTEESRRMKRTVQAMVNIRYGAGAASSTMDIYGMDLPADSPLLVYFSGGYWQELSGDISAYPVEPLVQKGIKCAIVDYDRAPKANMKVIVDQVIEAMKSIIKYAKENRISRVVLSGHSAGGHLCCEILQSRWYGDLPACDKDLVKAVFLYGGVYDLRPLVSTTINQPLGMGPKEAEALSPIHGDNLRRFARNLRGAEVHLYSPENESPALFEQTVAYRQALLAEDVVPAYYVLAGHDHFSFVEDLARSDFQVTRKVVQVCRGEGEAKN